MVWNILQGQTIFFLIKTIEIIFRSMAPLYPPGLDENGAVTNLYPASWICSKPGTIGITAVKNYCTRHQNPLLSRTIFSPAVKCRVQFFSPAVNFLQNENKKESDRAKVLYRVQRQIRPSKEGTKGPCIERRSRSDLWTSLAEWKFCTLHRIFVLSRYRATV